MADFKLHGIQIGNL